MKEQKIKLLHKLKSVYVPSVMWLDIHLSVINIMQSESATFSLIKQFSHH